MLPNVQGIAEGGFLKIPGKSNGAAFSNSALAGVDAAALRLSSCVRKNNFRQLPIDEVIFPGQDGCRWVAYG